MGKALDKIKKDLNNSPMYNLSLSSKELFHSNLLAWLGNNKDTKAFFAGIINELTKIRLELDGNWEIEREYNNFDLCVKEGDKYLLVIENKVKSIPRKNQLDEYVGKKVVDDDTRFLLLTLVDNFPCKDNVDIDKGKGGRWIIKTYDDLASAMHQAMTKNPFKEPYYTSILDDYIGFIQNLNELVGSWKVGIDDEFAKSADLGELKKLSDLYAKIQFSYYCILLQEKISKIDNIVVYDRGTIPENQEKDKLYILVDWGFASKGKQGLFDIGIPVEDLSNPKIKKGFASPDPECLIKIQVQGKSYRHVIESRNQDDLVSIGQKEPYTSKWRWFSKDPKSDGIMPSFGDKEIFEKGLYPNKRVKSWPFDSYNNKGRANFIYQYQTIKEKTDTNSVLENMVSEVKKILFYLNF